MARHRRSNVIGSEFFVPMLVALAVSSGTAMLGVWVFGGVLAFAGAMAYAELATLRPHAGGEYVYLHDAYGPLAAFMTGWTSFVAGFSGAIAATSVGLAAFIGRFVPAAADTTPLLTVPLPLVPLVVSKQAIVAILAIVMLSFVHFHANGRVVHNLLASAKVSLLLVFIAIGLGWGRVLQQHHGDTRSRQPSDRMDQRARAGDVCLLGLERRGVCC